MYTVKYFQVLCCIYNPGLLILTYGQSMYFPHFVFSLALWLAFNNIKINVVPLTSHQKAVEFLLCFIINLTF